MITITKRQKRQHWLTIFGIVLFFGGTIISQPKAEINSINNIKATSEIEKNPVVTIELFDQSTPDEINCDFTTKKCNEDTEAMLYLYSGDYDEIKGGQQKNTQPDLVLVVYMVDFLFNNGAQLSKEDQAYLSENKNCSEIDISCLTNTINKLFELTKVTQQQPGE